MFINMNDRVFIINLAERTDRMERARAQLNTVFEPFERFEAIKESPGWKGCRDSHLALLDKVKHLRWMEQYHYPLILEDDVELIPEWRDALRDAQIHIPLRWDILYLGCSPQSPLEKYNKYLYIAKNCLCTHAMLFNNSHRGVVDYILEHKDEINKIDVFYSQIIQEKFFCFTPTQLIATQWDNHSNTCTRSDVSTIAKNYIKYTQE